MGEPAPFVDIAVAGRYSRTSGSVRKKGEEDYHEAIRA
jgi:hypothetical protein